MTVNSNTSVNTILGHWCKRFFLFVCFVIDWKQACVASVVDRDVVEQISHGLLVVDAADGLSQDHADIHSLDFAAL